MKLECQGSLINSHGKCEQSFEAENITDLTRLIIKHYLDPSNIAADPRGDCHMHRTFIDQESGLRIEFDHGALGFMRVLKLVDEHWTQIGDEMLIAEQIVKH